MGYQSSFCLVVSICWQQIPGWFLSHIIKYIYIYVYIRAHLHIHNRSRRKDGQWHYIIHIVIKVFYCVSIFLGFATYIYYVYIYITHESSWIQLGYDMVSHLLMALTWRGPCRKSRRKRSGGDRRSACGVPDQRWFSMLTDVSHDFMSKSYCVIVV